MPATLALTQARSHPATAVSDSVDGTGFGRNLYRLAAVNHAGSVSSTTNSIGPYYTRIVTPPRPPVLYKLQPTVSAVIVAWALDTNPDVAAYLVYRASTIQALADLRYFGADWTHPVAASQLSSVSYTPTIYPPLSFVQGTAPNIDQRIVGFVPDPHLCLATTAAAMPAKLLCRRDLRRTKSMAFTGSVNTTRN